MNKIALITGITSQDGGYLAKLLINKGYQVVGLVRSNNNKELYNLKYLGIEKDILIVNLDLLDFSGLIKLFEKYHFDEIYNLAAQSSVGLSFTNPLTTIHFNSVSVINLLEVIRLSNNNLKFLQPVSSEMYGRNIELPINEESIIKPSSPYAISKALAYWSVKNYREAYNIHACNAILFNHESYLRSNSFFIKKVIRTALKIKYGIEKDLRVGNIDIKRDFGYAPEYVEAMWLILQSKLPDDFIICSGNSIKLRDIIEYVFEKLKVSTNKIICDPQLYRPLEINDIYGDNNKIISKFNWQYTKSFYEVLDILIAEEMNGMGLK